MVLIRDIMTSKPCVLSGDCSLFDACIKMRDNDTGMLPVSDKGDLSNIIGVLTDRDICIRAGAEGVDFKSTKVRDFISSDIHFLFQDEDVNNAAKVMKDCKCRRVLIYDNQQSKNLVGVVSLGDLASIGGQEKQVFETLKELYCAKPTPA